MARYFFHILDQGHMIPDEEGQECADLAAAKDEARASARDLATQAIQRGESPNRICVEIQDRAGRIIAALAVEEVLEQPRHPAFDAACRSSAHSHH